jgi:hypothetical protein
VAQYSVMVLLSKPHRKQDLARRLQKLLRGG